MRDNRLLSLACLLIAMVGVFATPSSQAVDGEVVRVYDVPRTDFNELRRLGDFWGIDWRENYVVMLVTERGRQALESAGYRVERDTERHAERLAFLGIDREAWARSGAGGIPEYPCYRTVDETTTDLAALAAAHPELARWESIGQSWETGQPGVDGDDLYVLVLGNQQVDHPQAPLLVMAAQHARELVTAEVATRFAEHLVNGYTTDPVARWLLDHRRIHIIAQQNPDGRRKVEGGTSLWRKNTNDSNCASSSYGVDLNRNSSFLYGGFSSLKCSDQTYRGPDAASEPETEAIQSYMDEVFERQRPTRGSGFDLTTPARDDTRGVFLSLHSFGRLVLFPWEGLGGQDENNAPNHDALAILGRKMGFYTDYAVGRWSLLGPASGTTVDYAYGEFGVAAYTLELGTSFLQDCESFEQTIWPDNRDALLFAAKAAERPYLAPAGPEVTALSAGFDASGAEVTVIGTADSGGYFRGKVPDELPIDDPIHPIESVTVSLDLPPQLAAATWALPLDGTGTREDFSGTIPVADIGERRLLFLQATDSEGNVGVASPVWLTSRVVFEDGFESP